MGTRLELQALLEEIVGSEEVYFQAPSNVFKEYPGIAYTLLTNKALHADNTPYFRLNRYQITVLTRDPESDIPDKVAALSSCVMERHFTRQNLHHYVFNLYF